MTIEPTDGGFHIRTHFGTYVQEGIQKTTQIVINLSS